MSHRGRPAPRWAALIAIVVTIAVPSLLHAQFVPAQDAVRWVPPAVSTFETPVRVAPDLSTSPRVEQVAALTIADPHGAGISGNVILLPDLYSGVVERRTLDLQPLAPLLNPVLGTAITGVTERTSDGSLFFIDGGAGRLLRTETDGALIEEFALDSPAGGTIGDLTYSPPTDTFWAIDLTFDLLFEFGADGSLTGQVVPQPDLGTLGTFGTGITARPTGELFVPTGRARSGRIESLYRIGLPSLGCMDRAVSAADWSELAGRDPFVAGIAWHPGLGGDEVVYWVGAASRTVALTRLGDLACTSNPPCDFDCTVVAGVDVQLSWRNNDTYSALELYRDGALIAALDPAVESAVDILSEPGVYSYQLRATAGGASCLGPICRARATDPDTLQAAIPGAVTPWGVTVVESTGRLYVSDLDSGLTSRFDLALGFVDTIASPASGVSGLAWRPATNTIFWVADELLLETNLDGMIIGTFPLESPGEGTLGGLTLTCDESALLVADIVDDAYYAVDFSGSPLTVEPEFRNTDSVQSSGAFGVGVARFPDGSGYASPRAPRPEVTGGPNRIVMTDCSGGTTDVTIPLGIDTDLDDPFVAGIAIAATSPLGTPEAYLYAIGSVTRQIFGTRVSNSSCAPPADLVCNVVGSTVELSWTNGSTYTSITVVRNCVDIGTYGSGTINHIDSAPVSGTSVYSICCECPNGRVVKVECKVCFDSNSNDLIVQKEDTLNGAVNSGAALRSALESAGRTVSVYDELQGKPIDDFRSVWVVLGTFPDNNALTPSEGVKLVEFLLSGKPVYLEGADLWGFDAPTVLFDYDGVDGQLADGSVVDDGDDSFTGMTGETFRSLNLLGFDAPYQQEQFGDDRTDRLVPTGTAFGVDIPGPGADLVWLDDGSGGDPSGYGTGLFYRPAASGPVIAVSWEFGGYGGDRAHLARRYLGSFGLVFVRGDVNGDVMVNVGDAIALLDGLFGGLPLTCDDSADTNDSGAVDIADAIHLLSFLFAGGPPPSAPFPDCGSDPTADGATCGGYSLCP